MTRYEYASMRLQCLERGEEPCPPLWTHLARPPVHRVVHPLIRWSSLVFIIRGLSSPPNPLHSSFSLVMKSRKRVVPSPSR